MANQHRRIERAIRGAVKKLKRGEIPIPPEPEIMSAERREQFWLEMEGERRRIQRNLKRLESDGSRKGHKDRLRYDQQLASIEELLKDRTENNPPGGDRSVQP